MAWQNQPGSSNPWQGSAPYPGQSSAPYGGMPGQPFPGQMPQIPPQVYQAAQAAGLGTPTREYNNGAGASRGGGIPGLGTAKFGLWFGLGIGGLSLVVVLVIALLLVPFPFNLISIGVVVLCALSILPFMGMFKMISGFGSGGSKGAIRFWGCPNGLVYLQGQQISTMSWEQLGTVLRKVAMVNGMFTTIGYKVQPLNTLPFEFSLLGGAFAGIANAGAGGSGFGSLSISTGAGEVSNYGGFTQINGAVDLSSYAGLGELIEEQLIQRQLPQAIAGYQQGQTVSFGQFMVHRQGLSDGVKTLAWGELADIQVSGAAIQITKKPANLPWFQLNAATIPNVAVLIALLNAIRNGQA
jgi:hypothetical protein